jgi:hypothetical protein
MEVLRMRYDPGGVVLTELTLPRSRAPPASFPVLVENHSICVKAERNTYVQREI